MGSAGAPVEKGRDAPAAAAVGAARRARALGAPKVPTETLEARRGRSNKPPERREQRLRKPRVAIAIVVHRLGAPVCLLENKEREFNYNIRLESKKPMNNIDGEREREGE